MTIPFFLAVLACVSTPQTQTRIDGSLLAYRSTGVSCPDRAWCLNENGFVGTYIRLVAADRVTFTIRASKGDSDKDSPMLRLRVADFSLSWPVTAVGPNCDTHTQRLSENSPLPLGEGQGVRAFRGGSSFFQSPDANGPHPNPLPEGEGTGISTFRTASQTWELPAGTYCVRIESADGKLSGGPRAIHVRDLSVAGATVVNTATDANALAAADTYIEHFRKGPAALTFTTDTRPMPDAKVQIRLKCHAFTFGTALSSSRVGIQGTSWITSSDPNAINYRNFVLRNFNAVVPENAGKWASNEPERDKLTLRHLDSLMDFAASSGKRVRMHGVLWDVSEPAWVRALKDTALNGSSQAERDAAKADLRARISQRIRYFVRDRAHRFAELDVLNEAVHRPMYFRIFGTDGVAGIYSEVKAAVQAAGASTRIVPNEYDVLQSFDRIGDPYANWYQRPAQVDHRGLAHH